MELAEDPSGGVKAGVLMDANVVSGVTVVPLQKAVVATDQQQSQQQHCLSGVTISTGLRATKLSSSSAFSGNAAATWLTCALLVGDWHGFDDQLLLS